MDTERMKIFFLVNLLAFSLAEPPVDDSYASALSGHNHEVDLHRTKQGYPSSSRSALSQQYGQPKTRSSLSQEYGVPGFHNSIPKEYQAPNSRSGLSQEYGAPSTRLSQEYGAPSARISLEYNQNARGLSQEYGAPKQGTGLSGNYNAPINSPSESYGAPFHRSSSLQHTSNFHSSPSEEYGTPSHREFDSNTFARNPSQQYGAPDSRNTPLKSNSLSQGYGAPFGRSSNVAQSFGDSSYKSSFGKGFSQARSSFNPSQSYGAPRSLSTQYGAPSSRNSDAFSQGYNSGSSYSSNQRSSPGNYITPNEGVLSQEYGAPLSRAGLQTGAFPSSFSSARSSPSSKYGAPSARNMPSDQYGLPDQYSVLSDQGYGYARGALDELLNQEPANYDFSYKVSDYETGSDFGHTETRQENRAEGTYFVVLPDGTKQVVEYEADERGFKPRISVEPVEGVDGRSGAGYDENASDLARSGEGGY